MAITTTFTKSVGWARTDVIYQLEEAFSWLGWHSDTTTGIVTSIQSYSGDTDTGSNSVTYYDVRQKSTSGIGTGASFNITRSSGNIDTMYVNRPGVGYTDGEQIVISGDDIGGSTDTLPATDITIVCGVDTTTGYGSTTTFYDKDVTAGANYPWGVLKYENESNKKFGYTYRGFQVTSNTNLNFITGSDFHPWDVDSTSNYTSYYGNRFGGENSLDAPVNPVTGSNARLRTNTSHSFPHTNLIFAKNTNSYQLDLNVFKSGLDPNFAVFSFKQPTLSSTNIHNNTSHPFFLHNYSTTLWDLDEVFLSGLTLIEPLISVADGTKKITFNSYPASETYEIKRSAEQGFLGTSYFNRLSVYSATIIGGSGTNECSFYYRDDSESSISEFNAIIKGIPINLMFVPCPYYLPDDFVFIQFDTGIASSNVQQGDTITVSASEVYTIITASYSQNTTTRGIAFCARTT